MSDTRTVEQFKEQLIQLNTELIQIEKKLSIQTDYVVCANHQKCVSQILKHYDQVAFSV